MLSKTVEIEGCELDAYSIVKSTWRLFGIKILVTREVIRND